MLEFFQKSIKRNIIVNSSNLVLSCPISFEMSSNGFYYVTDNCNNLVLQFDINWRIMSNIPATGLRYLKAAGNYMFATSDGFLSKYDANLTMPSISYINASCVFGLEYVPMHDAIAVLRPCSNQTFILNSTFSLIQSVSLPSIPYSVAAINDVLYIGTQNSEILIIEDLVYTKKYTNVCQSSTKVTSIYFDKYGYMLVSCFEDNSIRLYTVNGEYTGYYLNTSGNPYSVKLDSKGRLVVTCVNNSVIDIFY